MRRRSDRMRDLEALYAEHGAMSQPPDELDDDVVRRLTGREPEEGRDLLRQMQSSTRGGEVIGVGRPIQAADIEGFTPDGKPILKTRPSKPSSEDERP
jgi:hypothetical protein